MLPFPKLLNEFRRYTTKYGRIDLEQYVTNVTEGQLRLSVFVNSRNSSVSAKLIWAAGKRTFEGTCEGAYEDVDETEPFDEAMHAIEAAYKDCGAFWAVWQNREHLGLPSCVELLEEYPQRAATLVESEAFKGYWIKGKLVLPKDFKGGSTDWVWLAAFKNAVPPPMPAPDEGEHVRVLSKRLISPEAALDHPRLAGLTPTALRTLFVARELGRVGTVFTHGIPDFGTTMAGLRSLERRNLVDVIPKEDHPDGPYAVLTKKGVQVAQFIPAKYFDLNQESKRIKGVEKQRAQAIEARRKRA